jgi:hypothetical protein
MSVAACLSLTKSGNLFLGQSPHVVTHSVGNGQTFGTPSLLVIDEVIKKSIAWRNLDTQMKNEKLAGGRLFPKPRKCCKHPHQPIPVHFQMLIAPEHMQVVLAYKVFQLIKWPLPCKESLQSQLFWPRGKEVCP